MANQRKGMEYLKRLITKSKSDFPTAAMLYISQHCGLPNTMTTPSFGEGKMIPAVPASYIEKCKSDLSKLTTYTVESQVSMMSKVCSIILLFSLLSIS